VGLSGEVVCLGRSDPVDEKAARRPLAAQQDTQQVLLQTAADEVVERFRVLSEQDLTDLGLLLWAGLRSRPHAASPSQRHEDALITVGDG
jgi:hypothetical protein